MSTPCGIAIAVQAYPARAARRNDCGGWPKARMKARRIRSGSRNPVDCATRSIASEEDCTRWRATSMRKRSTAFDGVVPVSAMNAPAWQQGLPLAAGILAAWPTLFVGRKIGAGVRRAVTRLVGRER